MNKYFIQNGELKLTYYDPNRENPKASMYDEVFTAEPPAKPKTADGERAELKYDGTDLYYDVVKIDQPQQ